ncbi:hypothetical protein [Deinococcus roseus]|uniref:YopX protein domain-containing protein n=1 Tax=Deinococcus roseus TaxID=392414 RepID=A0ABQ2DEF3_9DEIO|nr:hypothetical protein [Deinococcus roseus]GGJ55265.1 hypothetical protein GCM10008938_46770 [Deinococcus roseus]
MSDKTIALWVGGQMTGIKKGFWLSVKVIEGHLLKEDHLHQVLQVESEWFEDGNEKYHKSRVAQRWDVGDFVVVRIQWLRKETKELVLGEKGIVMLEGDFSRLQEVLGDGEQLNFILASSTYQFKER